MQAGVTSRQGEEGGGEHISESESGLASVVICSVRGIGEGSRWGRTDRERFLVCRHRLLHVSSSRLICDAFPRACCEDCCVHAVYSLHTRLTRKKCGDTRTSGAGDCRERCGTRLRSLCLWAPGVGRGSSVRLGTPSLWPAPHRAAARARYAQPPPPPL